MKLSKEEFTNQLITVLSADYKVRSFDVDKGDHRYPGLCIMNKDVAAAPTPANVASPTFNLDNWYTYYIQGDSSVRDVANCIVDERERLSSVTSQVNGFVGELQSDKNMVLDHVFERICTADKVLENIVFDQFMDLAVVYVIKVEKDELETNMVITKSVLDFMGITHEEIREAARLNRNKQKYDLVDLSTIFDPFGSSHDSETVYLLKTIGEKNGASAMLDSSILNRFSDDYMSGEDFMILPSSVHEVLCVKRSLKDIDIAEFESLISSVNRDWLMDDDVLSGHVYIYSRKREQLVMPDEYDKVLSA